MQFDYSSTNHPLDQEKVKILILGSGPAGLAAALYAARAELNPVVVTGLALGGQAATTDVIENYPGFPDGIGGLELGELFQKQAERFGARLVYETVSSADLTKDRLRISTDMKEYLADSLIIATGAAPNHLNIPGENEFTGKGVSYCGTCDGWFFKDKRVVVVGGGDSALEEALFLTRYATKVNIVHRRDTLRAVPILQHRANENAKISYSWNSVITEIIGTSSVESVRLKDVVSNNETILPTDGVFIFIGHTPCTSFFKDQIDLDERGFIKIDMKMQTSVPGVFAAGEVADPNYRQVITSAGMGAASAIQATRFLEKHAG